MNTARLLDASLELLVLRALSEGDNYAYGIIGVLQRCAGGPLLIEHAMLHSALCRLEEKSLIECSRRIDNDTPRLLRYSITPLGAERLAEEENEWHRFVDRMDRMLQGQGSANAAHGARSSLELHPA